MDKTVPPGAALLLDFIGSIEAPGGYGVIFANRQDRLEKPLTGMTVDEVLAGQATWSRWKKPASSAAGRYQFMRATLTQLKKELGLRGTQKLDPNLQDRLAYHLLKRRGYDEFVAGEIGITEFGKRLAQEWASLPVLAATKGGSRHVKRGQSYYSGDGLNKSLIKPEAVEAMLERALLVARQQANAPVDEPTQPEPETPATDAPTGFQVNWFKVGLWAALAAGLVWLITRFN
jgi:hypothetical protein